LAPRLRGELPAWVDIRSSAALLGTKVSPAFSGCTRKLSENEAAFFEAADGNARCPSASGDQSIKPGWQGRGAQAVRELCLVSFSHYSSLGKGPDGTAYLLTPVPNRGDFVGVGYVVQGVSS
jgi:hypothetical protein